MMRDIHQEISRAKWILCPEAFAAPVIQRKFSLQTPVKARMAVSALGFFTVYINGQRVGDEYFKPSVSLFRERNCAEWGYPIFDRFTYRSYYSVYDVTRYLKDGENLLEIALADGWYRQKERVAEGYMPFGDELGAIYALGMADEAGERWICSDGSEVCHPTATIYSQLFQGEVYDAQLENAVWDCAPVHVAELPDTLLSPEIAPPDRVIRTLAPKLVREEGNRKIYDARENISGFAVIRTRAGEGESVRIRYAENLKDGELDFASTGAVYRCPDGRHQIMEDVFVGDGREHLFRPQFVWHAFRYFEVVGDALAESVEVIHSDVAQIAGFHSSSPELNWLFETFLRTQTNNMHGGVPSDCPHRERLGYTGDGQACAPAAMAMLDAQNFYRKWICDIFDSQDADTGHVNHTAPFMGGGGGPGGWGCAAVLVPYYYYKAYGDSSLVEAYYNRMARWIDYLRARCEDGLVVREEAGGWCLGDWCTLDPVAIPEPFVNTCYLIRCLTLMEEMAALIGRAGDAELFREYRAEAEEGVIAAYYDAGTHSFAGGVQGADAFALWAGLGDTRTLENLQRKYAELGHFDTGFLCTDILCGILFANGGENIAYRLLTSHDPGSFGWMMDHDATTIWETWTGDVSHDHPMFGAAAQYLLSDILGIGQRADSAGYAQVVIAPKTPEGLDFAEGFRRLPIGHVDVRWTRNADSIAFVITLPEGIACEFRYGDTKCMLHGGVQVIECKKS